MPDGHRGLVITTADVQMAHRPSSAHPKGQFYNSARCNTVRHGTCLPYAIGNIEL
jgi:hypothetical protein